MLTLLVVGIALLLPGVASAATPTTAGAGTAGTSATAATCPAAGRTGTPVRRHGHRVRLGTAPCTTARPARTAPAHRPRSVGGRISPAAIDATDRAAVLAAYQDLLDAEAVPAHWTGSAATCKPGTVDTAFTDATLQAINLFRALAGLPPVVFSATLNTRAQAAALIMEAKSALTHAPVPDDPCYTTLGADGAGTSNLCLGCTGATAIEVYMDDPGAGNAAVGHRRWILYPLQTTMGSGSTARANALVVLDTDSWSAPVANPPWIAWPPAGYLPSALVPARLSLSRDGADFSAATASVTVDGQAVTSSIVARNGGYGDPTIVVQIDRAALALNDPGPDRVITVSVAGIKVGASTVSHAWTFRSISGDTVAPSVTIASPAHHAVFLQGASVLADYACDDGAGSGVASCTGPVADGAAIDTDALGFHLFTVDATDNDGNHRAVSHRYEVVTPPRPDAVVALGTGTPIGDGVYSATAGADQTLAASIARGGKRTFTVRLQNDGGTAAAFRVRGRTRGASGYTVTYRSSGKDVTAAVRAGTWTLAALKPGASVTLSVIIVATRRAAAGSTLDVDVSLTSVATPAVRDTVRASVHRGPIPPG
ncbi:MAG: CAP domain-containing protein [Chloroflexota bacterium]